MKICFLAPANSIHSHKWISYFAKKGYEVHWISLHPSIDDNFDNISYYELKQSTIKMFRIFKWSQIRKLVKNIKPDLLHVHSAGIYGLLGAIIHWHPLVLTAWGSDILMGGKSPLKSPIVKYVLRNADLITCDANHMIESMVHMGIEEEKINMICFGIDTDKFRPTEKDIELRKSLEIQDGSLAIISLRNFKSCYDVESLIKALPYVIKKAPTSKFIIVGSGPQEEMLKNLATSLKVFQHVKFTGEIPNAALANYLTSMDIYISTSLTDAGIAASTAEAMACELPVIITDTGENRKWINNGENGLIIHVRDPKALSEKIVYLIENVKTREILGKNARQTIVERNNYHKEMSKVEIIYKRLVPEA